MQFFKVFSVALFHGEEIHEDLHLMVTQSPDESHVVVYGEVWVNNSVFSFPLKFLSNIIIYQSCQGVVDSVITHFLFVCF